MRYPLKKKIEKIIKKFFRSFFVPSYRKIKDSIRRPCVTLKKFTSLQKETFLRSVQNCLHPSLGQRGERAAERFLKKQRWVVLARNFAAAHGEIDLIMRDGQTIVFVEVKTRKNAQFLQGIYARFNLKKQRHIYYTSQTFLKRFRLHGLTCRYDLVTVLWSDSHKKPKIKHYRNALLFEKILPK